MSAPTEGRIVFEDVSKTFTGRAADTAALRGVSLEIAPGTIYGVIGYSGAGKSTLIRLVNGLEHPTSGRVVVDGVDIGSLQGSRLRTAQKRTGMIFQQFNLLETVKVRDNVALPLRLDGVGKAAARARADEVLEFVGLGGKADSHAGELSGGQKQRVGIARALVRNPKILLSDEATSALDPTTTGQIIELLRSINREYGTTILVVTHEMDVIKDLAEEVAVMAAGEVVEQGTVLDTFLHPKADITRRLRHHRHSPGNSATRRRAPGRRRTLAPAARGRTGHAAPGLGPDHGHRRIDQHAARRHDRDPRPYGRSDDPEGHGLARAGRRRAHVPGGPRHSRRGGRGMNDDKWTLITPEVFLTALGETLQMLGVALALGSVLGIAIGTVLALTRPGGVLPNRPVNLILGIVVNLIRSLPFIILLVAILPFTRLLVGTSIGVWAAIVPLTVMIAPYIGRLVENSLLEVPQGVIEAARAMGASPFQIFWRFLLPEARSSLILALTIASVGLVDATAMAGTVGAGGIGDLALSYGYQRYDGFAMVITAVTLIILVQGLQTIGTGVARRYRRR